MSYGGDFDRGAFLDIINWVFTSITLIVVLSRFLSSSLLEKRSWGFDDGFIILATAVVLTRTIYISYCIHLGYGQHLHPLLEEDPVKATKLARLLIILLAISLWTWTIPKFPVAILLVRLFGKTKPYLAVILYSSVAFLAVWVTILTIVTFVQCNPISKNWNPLLPGECWNPRIYLNMGYFGGALSVGLDFGFAIFPITQISTLHMERSRKLLIALSLSLGIPAGVITLYKITTLASLINQHDPTWATVPLEVWNSVESCALLIAVSAPMTRPLMVLIGTRIKDLSQRFTGSSGTRSRGTMRLDGESNIQRSDDKVAVSMHPRIPLGIQKSSNEVLLEDMNQQNQERRQDIV